jgi:hypothetical protein
MRRAGLRHEALPAQGVSLIQQLGAFRFLDCEYDDNGSEFPAMQYQTPSTTSRIRKMQFRDPNTNLVVL